MKSSAGQAALHTEIPIFRDGVGERFLHTDAYGRPVGESLVLRPELGAVPAFEFALNERLKELEQFRHPSFIHVQGLERMPGRLPRLSLLTDYVPGQRLAEILTPGTDAGAPPTTAAALFLLREILDALSVFHRQGPTMSHGILGPERIVIVEGRPRITEFVFGSALEQLRFSHDRYWSDLRVTVPPSAGTARFDRRTDVAQIGMLAVALFAGRLLGEDEHLANILGLLDALTEQPQGARPPLAQPLRSWLLRMLQLDLRRSYVSVEEARQGLEQAMTDIGIVPSGTELERLAGPTHRVLPRVAQPAVLSATAPTHGAAPTVSGSGSKKVAPALALQSRPPQRVAWRPHPSIAAELRRPVRGAFLLQLLAIAVVTSTAFAAARIVPAPAALFARSGTLVINSQPQGATLVIDGAPRGVTPATVTIKSGRHTIELTAGRRARTVDITVPAGQTIVETVALGAAARRGAASPAQPPSATP